MRIRFLKAGHGDCILITYRDDSDRVVNILIDGGPSSTYEYRRGNRKRIPGPLKELIFELKSRAESIDLLVLTHVDDDHIGGLLKWFAKDPDASEMVRAVWFNSARTIASFFHAKENKERLLPLKIGGRFTSIGQGVTFEDYLIKKNIWDGALIKAGDLISFNGLTIKVLSPNEAKLDLLQQKWLRESPETLSAKRFDDYGSLVSHLIAADEFEEDDSIPNGSSIAFILERQNEIFLLLADAHPSVVAQSLKSFGYSKDNPLRPTFVKLSHHGSKGNTSNELLDLIDCRDFVISSNGNIHKLPDKQCLSRIINRRSDVRFHFNYVEVGRAMFVRADFEAFPDFEVIEIGEQLFS